MCNCKNRLNLQIETRQSYLSGGGGDAGMSVCVYDVGYKFDPFT